MAKTSQSDILAYYIPVGKDAEKNLISERIANHSLNRITTNRTARFVTLVVRERVANVIAGLGKISTGNNTSDVKASCCHLLRFFAHFGDDRGKIQKWLKSVFKTLGIKDVSQDNILVTQVYVNIKKQHILLAKVMRDVGLIAATPYSRISFLCDQTLAWARDNEHASHQH